MQQIAGRATYVLEMKKETVFQRWQLSEARGGRKRLPAALAILLFVSMGVLMEQGSGGWEAVRVRSS